MSKKSIKIIGYILVLVLFIYITFKVTLVMVSNRYLSDIGDYSVNDTYTFDYSDVSDKLTFKNITIRNDFHDYEEFKSSNGVIYNLKNNEAKSMFYISIYKDNISNNSKLKSYLKKNNITSLYSAERFLYINRNTKNSIFTSVKDIISKQELINLVKINTTRSSYMISVNDNGYIYKLGDNIYNYMVFNNGYVYVFSFNNKLDDNLSYVKDIVKTIKIYD